MFENTTVETGRQDYYTGSILTNVLLKCNFGVLMVSNNKNPERKKGKRTF